MMDDPTDDPPQQVIASEYCHAWCDSSSVFGGETGTCQNGLGHQAVVQITLIPLTPPFFYETRHCSSEGTRYTLREGGEEVTLPACSPSAVADSPIGVGTAQVVYNAELHPVRVTLTGVTRSGASLVVLTGQQITAQLSAAFPVKRDAENKPIIQWSDPPAGAFKSYQHGATGKLWPLEAADKKLESLSFYTKLQAADCTVTCTATLDMPPNATLAGGLPQVAATCHTLGSLKPTVTRWDITSGVVRVFDLFTYGYYGAVPPPPTEGQNWANVTVDVPTPFSGGTGAFAQLVAPSRTLTRVVTFPPYTGEPTYRNRDHGAQGLDNQFPYPFGQQWTPGPGAVGSGLDSPSQSVTAPDRDYGGVDWRESSAEDSFVTSVIYLPPQVGNQGRTWIPLASYTWGWSGSTSVHPPWALDDSSTTGGVWATTEQHPEWTIVHTSPVEMGPW